MRVYLIARTGRPFREKAQYGLDGVNGVDFVPSTLKLIVEPFVAFVAKLNVWPWLSRVRLTFL